MAPVHMSKKKHQKAAHVLFLFILTASSVFAGRKIVVPHDFPTIHSALGEADEGDTVYVVNGVYRENIALTEGVVLMGQDMLKTVIDGRRRGPCVKGADDAVIANFTIRNGTTGILCRNARPTIERNFIVDNKGAGIHALLALPEINNNVIYRNEWTGIFLESGHGSRTSIDHNVILENGYCGIFCANQTYVLIKNNVLYRNKQYGIYVAPEAKRTRIINNNIKGNRRPFNSAAVVNPSNISKDPLFISPGHPDYNYFVKPASPCKGKGEDGTDIGLITARMVQVLATDKDGDGILDDIDQCPDVPEDRDGFEDEDGCPDFDNDRDGIYDTKDQCPDDAEDREGFQDEDGCPDYDNDKDGIQDVSDGCPNNPETVNGYKDQDGCPDEKPREIKQALILKGVNFKTASAELLEESYYVLEKVYNSLEAYPHVRVQIAGHTDSQGGDQYNLQLSLDRAEAVRSYLVMRGIAPDRMVARGYGETQPIADNGTAEGRAKNRRVELVPIK
ncbi:MAG: OmpA family protein [Chitinivibrionales bacterium]|nr:OmpA family protein [Chitinivibrionales bacterium]MBD3355857.1 OmpA family protein [Chitinivibrionales bacterium]